MLASRHSQQNNYVFFILLILFFLARKFLNSNIVPRQNQDLDYRAPICLNGRFYTYMGIWEGLSCPVMFYLYYGQGLHQKCFSMEMKILPPPPPPLEFVFNCVPL